MTENPWIEWKGGECPVPAERVLVRLRDGFESDTPIAAAKFIWEHSPARMAHHVSDIIAYRVVSS